MKVEYIARAGIYAAFIALQGVFYLIASWGGIICGIIAMYVVGIMIKLIHNELLQERKMLEDERNTVRNLCRHINELEIERNDLLRWKV